MSKKLRYKRIKGGEKNDKSGVDWTKAELGEVCSLYIELDGKNIHENNPKIHDLAQNLGRTVRSVENQLLGFRKVAFGETGRQNFNSLIPQIWKEAQQGVQKNKEQQLKELEDSKQNVEGEFKFKISSQLKNIIGKDLITDDTIAIFELVKNSYDAHAKKVKIIFETDKIIIWDDGKGMDKEDIINKWLFVAYSAKKEGVEDRELEKDEYKTFRNKVRPRNYYAGAKGIGRFSADRLGAYLKLTTAKPTINSKFHQLNLNWGVFEIEAKEQFDSINIDYKELSKTEYSGFNHGAIVEISELHSVWPRQKILDLKKNLEKLINPFEDIDKKDNKTYFSIEIICEREKDEDKLHKAGRNKVNGDVRNFIFETLKIKTTQVVSYTTEGGKYIVTELEDRGDLVYKIKEENPYNHIVDSKVHLFYLNAAAKINFTRLMGIPGVQFGNVFLFNNGFRVYPYGEENKDPFGIDRRKQQGYARNLGTRELIGRIEVWGNSDQFKETSSRDGGLISTSGTAELEDFLWETLKKLENFVAPILWKISERSGIKGDETVDDTATSQIINLIAKLADSKNMELIDYNRDLLKIFEDKIDETPPEVFDQLEKIAEQAGDKKFEDEILATKKEYLKVLKLKEREEQKRLEAEEKAFQAEEKRKAEEKKRRDAEEKAKEEEEKRKEEEYLRLKAEEEVREERAKRVAAEQQRRQRESQVRFLESIQSLDIEDVLNMNHQIGIDANAIDRHIINFKRKLDKDESASTDEVKSLLDKVSYAVKKILAVIRFTTKENFLAAARITKDDVILFYKNYIINILKHHIGTEIKITIDDLVKEPFIMEFKPIELTIIVDNLLNNSKKKNAKNVQITFELGAEDSLIMKYRDFGDGLDKSIDNANNIFERGYTTTKGSGLGLSHIKKILEEINGTIKVNTNVKPGIEFIINFRK